jgi:hypothetical protein
LVSGTFGTEIYQSGFIVTDVLNDPDLAIFQLHGFINQFLHQFVQEFVSRSSSRGRSRSSWFRFLIIEKLA